MKRKLLCALLAAIGVGANCGATAAIVQVDTTEYILEYDNSGFFGSITSTGGSSSSTLSFGWNFPENGGEPGASVAVTNGTQSSPFVLGGFTLEAKAGYVFTDLHSSAGGAFSTFLGGSVGAKVLSGTVSFNNGPAQNIGDLLNSIPPISAGLWSVKTLNSFGQYTKLEVSGMSYELSATAGSGAFAQIFGHPKDGPNFSFSYATVPVPEPETYALMLTGLGLVGLAARRRRRA